AQAACLTKKFANTLPIIVHCTDLGGKRLFLVGSKDGVINFALKNGWATSKIIKNEEMGAMLFMDIECYPPETFEKILDKFGVSAPEWCDWEKEKCQADYIENFLKGIRIIIDLILEFNNFALTGESNKKLTVDDFCVDQVCSKQEGGKLSAHIYCPSLVFCDIHEAMKNYQYYFISYMLKKSSGIPFWMKFSNPYKRIDESTTYMAIVTLYWRIKNGCLYESRWLNTCIDIAVYTTKRNLRMTGSGKIGDKSIGKDRMLRPYNFNNFWDRDRQYPEHYTEEAISTATKQSRTVWMTRCIQLEPKLFRDKIAPSWPKTRDSDIIDRGGRYRCMNWEDGFGLYNIEPFKNEKRILTTASRTYSK
ncbi:hypothetical protein HDV02_005453, partial [Globomyces sp. JEL0801]